MVTTPAPSSGAEKAGRVRVVEGGDERAVEDDDRAALGGRAMMSRRARRPDATPVIGRG